MRMKYEAENLKSRKFMKHMTNQLLLKRKNTLSMKKRQIATKIRKSRIK